MTDEERQARFGAIDDLATKLARAAERLRAKAAADLLQGRAPRPSSTSLAEAKATLAELSELP